MGRRLRYQPCGSLVETTVRTVHGRLLLRPSAAVNDLVLGVLGRAQRKYRMVLHAAAFLSNHFHLLASPESPQQLAAFMNFLDGNLAKEIGRLHDWREKVWARRYQAIPVSDEEPAQIGRLTYLLAHGVKEGLVARPDEWPGVHCAAALRDGSVLEGTWYDRTAEYNRRRSSARRAECVEGGSDPEDEIRCTERVVFTPLPCWAHLSPDEQRARVAGILDEIARDGKGRLALGRDAVRKQHPHQKPSRSKRSPAPAFHAASRAMRLALRAAYAEFLALFRRAADRLRRGDRLVVFPRGAFPPPLPCLAPS